MNRQAWQVAPPPWLGSSDLSEESRTRRAEELAQRERQRQERVEAHIKRSKTRRAIDVLFLTLYGGVGMSLLLTIMGVTELMSDFGFVPFLCKYPAALLYRPDNPAWQLGTHLVPKLDLFALCLYGAVHSFLIGLHRAVTYQRVFMPQ